jgi:hypothetical protein
VLFAVRVERGGPWDWSRDLRERDDGTSTRGSWFPRSTTVFMVLGNPLKNGRDVPHAICAPSEEAVRERLAEDN